MPTEQANLDQVKLLTSQQSHANLQTLTSKLVSDTNFRASFLENPTAALKAVGISPSTPIQLNQRDKLLLKLATDSQIVSLYQSGNIAGLRQYIAANYAGLAVPGVTKADAAADFDVVIETEVVAVAEIAAVAIAVASAVANPAVEASQIAQIGVLNARIAALEARTAMLESRHS